MQQRMTTVDIDQPDLREETAQFAQEAVIKTESIVSGSPANTSFAASVINSMEQGVLVWSATGSCLMHNDRIFDVLELRAGDIFEGRLRRDFLALAIERGEITQETASKAEERFRSAAPFSFERTLPSGRTVSTNARPMASGGFVVTFSDVTNAKRKEAELAEAKRAAEAAEAKSRLTLEAELVRQQQMELLAELDEWLQSCKSLDELFRVVSAFMEKLLPGTAGELYIYSNSRDVLDGCCHWNSGAIAEHIAPDSCWALRRGRPFAFGTGTIDFACGHIDEHASALELDKYLCVPIVAHGDTVGLLHIRFAASSNGGADGRETSDTSQFAVQCAEHISLAIANVKLRDELRDQSIRDPLTGLVNRRYFLESLRSELNRAERKGTSVGLISFDADRFKTLNDNHGHDAGDIALRAISDILHAQFCGQEVICRYGGEEFCVLIPDADLELTRAAAEQFRSSVENYRIRYGNGQLPQVTISAGVAAFPNDGRLPQDLLKAADVALYSAKAAGRNCVRVSEHATDELHELTAASKRSVGQS